MSDKMNKTRVVAIDRLKKHKRYEKYYTVTTRIKAHDAENAFHTGDVVIVEETKPISRTKRWNIVELAKKKIA